MESTTGLYIAYEIAKGVGIFLGADENYSGVADRLISISKLMPKPPGVATEPKTLEPLAQSGSIPNKSDRLSSLLTLLANSSVKVDAKRLRDSLDSANGAITIGNISFVGHHKLVAARMRELPNLQGFNALTETTIWWDNKNHHFLIHGILDRNPLNPSSQKTVKLSHTESNHQVSTIHGNGGIKFMLTTSRRSNVEPIAWQQNLPTLQIYHCAPKEQILMAEIVAPYRVNKRTKE